MHAFISHTHTAETTTVKYCLSLFVSSVFLFLYINASTIRVYFDDNKIMRIQYTIQYYPITSKTSESE